MAKNTTESGWVIERYFFSELQYWTGRGIDDTSFSRENMKAVRFAREEDATFVLSGCFAGQGRVAEHQWVGPATGGR